jgi:hypothetical protein
MDSMTKALRTGDTHAPREMRILRIDDSLRTCAEKHSHPSHLPAFI